MDFTYKHAYFSPRDQQGHQIADTIICDYYQKANPCPPSLYRHCLIYRAFLGFHEALNDHFMIHSCMSVIYAIVLAQICVVTQFLLRFL
jgi:hypothetical protein